MSLVIANDWIESKGVKSICIRNRIRIRLVRITGNFIRSPGRTVARYLVREQTYPVVEAIEPFPNFDLQLYFH